MESNVKKLTEKLAHLTVLVQNVLHSICGTLLDIAPHIEIIPCGRAISGCQLLDVKINCKFSIYIILVATLAHIAHV